MDYENSQVYLGPTRRTDQCTDQRMADAMDIFSFAHLHQCLLLFIYGTLFLREILMNLHVKITKEFVCRDGLCHVRPNFLASDSALPSNFVFALGRLLTCQNDRYSEWTMAESHPLSPLHETHSAGLKRTRREIIRIRNDGPYNRELRHRRSTVTERRTSAAFKATDRGGIFPPSGNGEFRTKPDFCECSSAVRMWATAVVTGGSYLGLVEDDQQARSSRAEEESELDVKKTPAWEVSAKIRNLREQGNVFATRRFCNITRLRPTGKKRQTTLQFEKNRKAYPEKSAADFFPYGSRTAAERRAMTQTIESVSPFRARQLCAAAVGVRTDAASASVVVRCFSCCGHSASVVLSKRRCRFIIAERSPIADLILSPRLMRTRKRGKETIAIVKMKMIVSTAYGLSAKSITLDPSHFRAAVRRFDLSAAAITRGDQSFEARDSSPGSPEGRPKPARMSSPRNFLAVIMHEKFDVQVNNGKPHQDDCQGTYHNISNRIERILNADAEEATLERRWTTDIQYFLHLTATSSPSNMKEAIQNFCGHIAVTLGDLDWAFSNYSRCTDVPRCICNATVYKTQSSDESTLCDVHRPYQFHYMSRKMQVAPILSSTVPKLRKPIFVIYEVPTNQSIDRRFTE
ncbi:unnamed protein product [Nesidiocoris tenuis]|uniref:Uncharacterized protein n=1 Tax=Nesidiocoris tenuis TaxID=355587 RepID=A0A6H5GZ45_9HEMI|nr:unnamed protein product [Nesidiocoris tenuis]